MWYHEEICECAVEAGTIQPKCPQYWLPQFTFLLPIFLTTLLTLWSRWIACITTIEITTEDVRQGLVWGRTRLEDSISKHHRFENFFCTPKLKRKKKLLHDLCKRLLMMETMRTCVIFDHLITVRFNPSIRLVVVAEPFTDALDCVA